MSHREMQGALGWRVWVALAVVASLAVLPASASAAAGTATLCGGFLKRAPTVDEPNSLSYQFQCNWGITAYTLIINRQRNDASTMDDFSPTALVSDTSGNLLTTVSFTCAGSIPGNGVSCNTGGGTAYMPAPDYAEGSFDTSDPYCANIPAGSAPGTVAEPAAMVQLVVTDTNGAQSGPFRLGLSPACPAPPKPKPKPKKKHHHKKP